MPLPSPQEYYNNAKLRSSFPSHFVASNELPNILAEIYCERSPDGSQYHPTDRLRRLAHYAASIDAPILPCNSAAGENIDLWCRKYDPGIDYGEPEVEYHFLRREQLEIWCNERVGLFRCGDLVFWFQEPDSETHRQRYTEIMILLYHDFLQIALEQMTADFRVTAPLFDHVRPRTDDSIIFTVATSQPLTDEQKDKFVRAKPALDDLILECIFRIPIRLPPTVGRPVAFKFEALT